ncbi:DUF11 domain-containing protein [Paenibacillus sp. YYML68]|uniref:DUF11 domain-containing protein n=1 Tax=Paenibacillus sp. YYML68 TaxID=2909250 RepID=UPI00248F7B07|nr:DUF11 domain-containing protein [Paenibacillus sp. YYML68]
MTVVQRFNTVTNGAITFTGNTIGLSKQANTNNQGDQDSIGAMATPNLASQVNDFPPGTTLNYTENAASAILELPAQSTVLYAELVWSGSYSVSGEDLSAFIDDNVEFTTPSGVFSIAFDPATAATLVNTFYVRSADVTAIVQGAGAGAYTVGQLVATTSASSNTTNAGGWTLMVAYGNPTLPVRDLSIFVTSEFVSSGSGSTPVTISGFVTPASGPVSGRLQVSALEGDSNRTGDQLLFGPTVGTMTPSSGPNNPIDNFFASQINGNDGTLNTTGTFGSLNQPLGTNADGRRQGYDITNIDVSSQMINSQNSAAIQGTTSGDAYLINGIGLQIDVNAPQFEAVKSADVTFAKPGDVITYQIEITNTGSTEANVVFMFDAAPVGTTLVPNSVTIDGVPQPGADPSNLSLGTIEPEQTVVVEYQLLVTCNPASGQYVNQALFEFEYQMSPESPVSQGYGSSNELVIQNFRKIIGAQLAAIGLQEVAMAHLINSSAEMVQAAVGTLHPNASPMHVTVSQLLEVNSAVSKTLKKINRKEMLLLDCFDEILEFISASPNEC